jgi:hypothetical protein
VWGQVWFGTYWGYDPIDDAIGSGRGGTLLGAKVGDKARKVQLVLDLPEYKEALALARRWYTKGYFDKDVVPDNDMIANGQLQYGSSCSPAPAISPPSRWLTPNGKPSRSTPASSAQDAADHRHRRTGTPSAPPQESDLAVKAIEEVNQNEQLYNLLNFGIEGNTGSSRTRPTNSLACRRRDQ